MREDLIGKHAADTPYLLDWELFDKSPDGFFNTPATYPIYITGLNVAHMIKQGGLNYYIELANNRSSLLYGFVDSSGGFYFNKTDVKYRSRINVPIRLRPDVGEGTSTYTRLENLFCVEANKAGFKQLKGHSSNPGLRISLYNAMSIEGVQALINFMRQF